MGIFQISRNEKIIYLLFHISDNEIIIHLLDLEDCCYFLKLSCESDSVKEWAKILKQTPEKYILEFSTALKEYSKQKLQEERPEHCHNEENKQYHFEVDNTNNLIWRQVFTKTKISGKRGIFLLEKQQKKDSLKIAMNFIMEEFHGRELVVARLEEENQQIKKDNSDLRKIAEDSVRMKENFEKEIYGKFSDLLNAKKNKINELSMQLNSLKCNISDRPTTSEEASPTAPSTSNTTKTKNNDFDDDTDIDTPDTDEDIPIVQDDTSHKRKEYGGNSSSNNPRTKLLKTQSEAQQIEENFSDSQNSEDLLNASIEAELKFGFKSVQRAKLSSTKITHSDE